MFLFIPTNFQKTIDNHGKPWYNITIVKVNPQTSNGEKENKMKNDIAETIRRINERAEQNRLETNALIDKYKLAYKVKDSEGNTFTWGGVATGGFPWYRGRSGSKHIFNLNGLTIIQQYAE